MTRERYNQWIGVWSWFQTQAGTPALMDLHAMLNEMWEQDRQTCTPEQLASYSEPLELENDPEFRKFLSGLDRRFSKGTE